MIFSDSVDSAVNSPYLALNHNIYPETWDENEKKNFFHKLQKTD